MQFALMKQTIFVEEDTMVGQWEVWIEEDLLTGKPHLYVFGDAWGKSASVEPKLVRQDFYDGQLHLDLKNAQACEEGYFTEVIYSEEIREQVSEVLITLNGQVISREPVL